MSESSPDSYLFVMDSVLYECILFSIDAVLFTINYRMYRELYNNEKSIKEAESFDIDNKLSDKVKKSGGVVPYAVIRGTVKATRSSLRSQYIPHIRGVIREKITKERKVKWNPVLRIWTTFEQDIQRSQNSVPFTLIGNSQWFSSKVQIEDALSANLELPTIYDHVENHEGNFKDAFVSWFQGERVTGVHEIENMLTEDVALTGIGELAVENNVPKLRPPSSGYPYLLTPLTLDSLLKKIRNEVRFFKIISIVLGSAGLALLTVILVKCYRIRKQKLEIEKRKRREQQAIIQRRLEDPNRRENQNQQPVCVICLSNPVESVILECGHACLCLDCSQMMVHSRQCPVCRSIIQRIVPTYLP